MTTYTITEVGTRLLKYMGLCAAEETPSAADQSWAEELSQSEILAMGTRGIKIWNGSELEIPQEYLVPLLRRLSLAPAPSFGLADPAAVVAAIPIAEAELRSMGTTPATGATLVGEYI